MNEKIFISDGISFNTRQFATQANAILGLKKSGKSYTATYIAEQLMNNGIPIIAFDPIGIWKYLKRADKGPGYPVVVAGEDGDLPLTVESAPNIVRAAIKENVSLVIDLYSRTLSKADWRRIVEQCIELLIFENRNLRHIFIEEAAEFCPQKIRPEDGRVYNQVERLARMGGNYSLGTTLINQRAEEVNKAVLELSDCLFLHRQKGRHSLIALKKWLEVADVVNVDRIIKSLPSLQSGECYVWPSGSHNPVRIKVPEKRTFHPDRDNPVSLTELKPMADISKFLIKMKAALEEHKPPPEKKNEKVAPIKKESLVVTKKELPVMEENHVEEKLNAEVEHLKVELKKEKILREQAQKKLAIVKKMLEPQYKEMKKIFDEVDAGGCPDTSAYTPWLDKFNGKNREMLEKLIEHGSLTKSQLALQCGLSATSGTFSTYISNLSRVGLIAREGDKYVLQPING